MYRYLTRNNIKYTWVLPPFSMREKGVRYFLTCVFCLNSSWPAHRAKGRNGMLRVLGSKSRVIVSSNRRYILDADGFVMAEKSPMAFFPLSALFLIWSRRLPSIKPLQWLSHLACDFMVAGRPWGQSKAGPPVSFPFLTLFHVAYTRCSRQTVSRAIYTGYTLLSQSGAK